MAAVEPRRRPGPPIATVVFALITALGAAAQLSDPDVLDRFRRDYPALHDGEWWRWFTPLLVQGSGWGQILFNIGSLLVVGGIAERRFGTLRWLVLYTGIGLAGEAFGERLDPTGSGNSLAVCGLAGALATLLLLRSGTATRLHAFVVPYYVACVAGLGFGGVIGATVTPTVVLVVMSFLLRRGSCTGVAFVAGLAGLLGAAALAARPDQHGIALLCGAVAGVLLFPPRHRAEQQRWDLDDRAAPSDRST
ncbi:rhomboid family intramembrane serine protease [Dactylosporangium sp. NPDC000521]|uniref:rhomboid family intramembrane serine protease n=1 Tax=Dactylosporangium sp. NPDC000521 TaxID=3363975 RepID=UPI0036CB45BC